jgi:hypothetical protein
VAQGDVLYRSATQWVNLGPGTSGQFLRTNGAAANPSWAGLNATDLSPAVILAPATDARNVIVPTADTVKALAVRRFSATHSDNLFEAQDENGVALSGVGPTGRIYAPDGLGGTPAITFLADTDTGMYRVGDNRIRLVTGSNTRVDISDDGFLTFIAPLTTGMDFQGNAGMAVIFRPSIDATALLPEVSSPAFDLRGKYWNGSSSVNTSLSMDLTVFSPTVRVARLGMDGTNRILFDNSQRVGVGINVNSLLDALWSVQGDNAARAVAVYQGAASQAEDILRVQNDSAVTLSRFNKNGYFITHKTAAPADAEIATSSLAIWLDDTNGAAKAKFKAKQANGTVVTGEVALA